MARAVADIERDIAVLCAKDKAALLRALIADLDAPAEANAERAWLDESERRLAEIVNGTTRTVSGRDVLNEARSRLK